MGEATQSGELRERDMHRDTSTRVVAATATNSQNAYTQRRGRQNMETTGKTYIGQLRDAERGGGKVTRVHRLQRDAQRCREAEVEIRRDTVTHENKKRKRSFRARKESETPEARGNAPAARAVPRRWR